MPFQDFARALVVDAIDTTGKIRENVAHLRDLGRAAKAGTKAAIQATENSLANMLERAADDLRAGKDAWQKSHGKGFRR